MIYDLYPEDASQFLSSLGKDIESMVEELTKDIDNEEEDNGYKEKEGV